MISILKQRKHYTMVRISIGGGAGRVEIPVFDKHFSPGGSTLLVTAGIDGDEYAGIEAAYRLIELYSTKAFYGRLIILPVVNMPGFESGMSRNPDDGKYPKNIFPGEANGTSSERLIYWLFSSFLDHADLWMDLHGGANDEELQPFVWAFETKDQTINTLVYMLMKRIDIPLSVYEKHSFFSKAHFLAKKRCGYVMVESGQKGERNPVDSICHIRCVEVAMGLLGMIADGRPTRGSREKRVFRRVREYQAPGEGLWYPGEMKRNVKKDDILGDVRSLTQVKRICVKAMDDGVLLWRKTSPFLRARDIVAGVGYDPLSFDLFAKIVSGV